MPADRESGRISTKHGVIVSAATRTWFGPAKMAADPTPFLPNKSGHKGSEAQLQ